MSSGVANTKSLENGTDLTAVAGEAGGETFVEFFDESISVQNSFSDVTPWCPFTQKNFQAVTGRLEKLLGSLSHKRTFRP